MTSYDICRIHLYTFSHYCNYHHCRLLNLNFHIRPVIDFSFSLVVLDIFFNQTNILYFNFKNVLGLTFFMWTSMSSTSSTPAYSLFSNCFVSAV